MAWEERVESFGSGGEDDGFVATGGEGWIEDATMVAVGWLRCHGDGLWIVSGVRAMVRGVTKIFYA